MQDKEQILIGKLSSDYIGDDAAVVGDMLYSADAFCEDIHFRRAWMSPAQIGRKAMLVNLSDVVAMNALPKYALVTLSLPDDFSEPEINALVKALEDTAAEWGCEIIGGDTVGGDKLNLSITLISHSDAPLMRTGLREGDLLAYTGELGPCRQDLERLEAGETIAEDSRFFVPILRGEFIRRVRRYLRVGMDISDGLYCDTNTLLNANNTGIKMLKSIRDEAGESGEEYEMLIGLDPRHRPAIESIAESMGISVTFYGEIAHNTDRFPCKSHHFG